MNICELLESSNTQLSEDELVSVEETSPIETTDQQDENSTAHTQENIIISSKLTPTSLSLEEQIPNSQTSIESGVENNSSKKSGDSDNADKDFDESQESSDSAIDSEDTGADFEKNEASSKDNNNSEETTENSKNYKSLFFLWKIIV